MATTKKPAGDGSASRVGASAATAGSAVPKTTAAKKAVAAKAVPNKPTPAKRAPKQAAPTPKAAATAAAQKAEAARPVATPPGPVVSSAPEKKDRTVMIAAAFLGAVALFAAGFGIGRASGDDGGTAIFGSGHMQILPGMGGMGPFGHDGMGMTPGRPGQRGGGFFPGPGNHNEGRVPPPPASDQAFLGISGVDGPGGGVTVAEVVAGSGAEAAGLQVDDRIVSVDGTEIVGMGQLSNVIASARPGATITIAVDRAGAILTFIATLGSRAG